MKRRFIALALPLAFMAGLALPAAALAQVAVTPAADPLAQLNSPDAKLAYNKKLVFDLWRTVVIAGHAEDAQVRLRGLHPAQSDGAYRARADDEVLPDALLQGHPADHPEHGLSRRRGRHGGAGDGAESEGRERPGLHLNLVRRSASRTAWSPSIGTSRPSHRRSAQPTLSFRFATPSAIGSIDHSARTSACARRSKVRRSRAGAGEACRSKPCWMSEFNGTPELLAVYPDKLHLLFEPVVEFTPAIERLYQNVRRRLISTRSRTSPEPWP